MEDVGRRNSERGSELLGTCGVRCSVCRDDGFADVVVPRTVRGKLDGYGTFVWKSRITVPVPY